MICSAAHSGPKSRRTRAPAPRNLRREPPSGGCAERKWLLHLALVPPPVTPPGHSQADLKGHFLPTRRAVDQAAPGRPWPWCWSPVARLQVARSPGPGSCPQRLILTDASFACPRGPRPVILKLTPPELQGPSLWEGGGAFRTQGGPRGSPSPGGCSALTVQAPDPPATVSLVLGCCRNSVAD